MVEEDNKVENEGSKEEKEGPNLHRYAHTFRHMDI
jgi:hypothetical protein